jgi:hypothetical protein
MISAYSDDIVNIIKNRKILNWVIKIVKVSWTLKKTIIILNYEK